MTCNYERINTDCVTTGKDGIRNFDYYKENKLVKLLLYFLKRF